MLCVVGVCCGVYRHDINLCSSFRTGVFHQLIGKLQERNTPPLLFLSLFHQGLTHGQVESRIFLGSLARLTFTHFIPLGHGLRYQ